MTRFVLAAVVLGSLSVAGSAFAQSPVQGSWTGTPERPAVDPLDPLADAFPALSPAPTPAPRSYFVASGFWQEPGRVMVDHGDLTTVTAEARTPVFVEPSRTAELVYRTLLAVREAELRAAVPHDLEVRLLAARLK